MHELETAYHRLWEAMQTKDARAIREICAPDYTLTHLTGDTQNLDDFIKELAEGTLNYYQVRHDSITPRTTDATHATLAAMSRIDAAVYQTPRAEWPLRGELTAERRDGQWVFTSLKTSLY